MNAGDIHGDVRRFDLVEWFTSEFTDDEQEVMANTYQPGADSPRRPLIEGNSAGFRTSRVSFLSSLAGWFVDPGHLSIAERVFDKATSLASDETDVLDRHCLLSEVIRIYSRQGKQEPYRSRALDACRQQVAISGEAAVAWRMNYAGFPMPSHQGLERLSILLERQGEYEDAIQLCTKALNEGWPGDWEKRIARCRRSVARDNPLTVHRAE